MLRQGGHKVMPLTSYHKKRIFSKTSEPKGKRSSVKGNLYVIQKHAARHLHYDFRLELNGVLLSWAIPKGPCLDPSVKRLAVQVEDHPIEYGNFEGTIPKGQYGGGTVMLWDQGKWICENDDSSKAYQNGHLSFTLQGKKLHGRWHLIRFKNEDENWFLIKSKDKYAISINKYDITISKPNSVLSKNTLEQIAHTQKKIPLKKSISKLYLSAPKKPFPKVIKPQLATLVDTPPAGTKWLHEIKLDGYRIIAFKNGDDIRLISRNNKNLTKYFDHIVQELKKIPLKKVIMDGEIVVLDKNQHTNFQLLQNSIKNNAKNNMIYYVFDLLYYDKYDLTRLPLIERKKILHTLIPSSVSPVLRYSDHIIDSGKEVFEKACKMSLEGIISKALNSPYEQKRTKTWLKIKCLKQQEFIIGGYTQPKGSRNFFGALLVGYYNDKKQLIYCGKVGIGFDEDSLKHIFELLKKHHSSQNPFNEKSPVLLNTKWVKPTHVAEIKFSEWTKKGMLRHPSFNRLHDKTSDITKDNTRQSIKFTNPNKKLYPEDNITKKDIYNYYDSIHTWILPYVANRPLMLVRCPNTYKKCFYQKHFNKTMPNVIHNLTIELNHKIENYIFINDRKGLLSLVQLGVLEMHPWGSQIKDDEYPDRIILDLDPSDSITWKKIVASAKLIKKYLEKCGLKSFVKTTGGKGLHVVIPIQPEYDWSQIKNFSKTFVEWMVLRYPDLFVSVISKTKRSGKIYIDYLRNQRGSTSIAAYSTRARKGAPVSVPLDWDELTDRYDDTYYTIFTLPTRLENLKQDPWRNFYKIKQSLKKIQYPE